MANYIKKRQKPSTKRRNKRKNKNTYFVIPAVLIIFLAIYLIILSIHPVGVIEYLKSEYISVGTGSGYDIDIHDGKPIYTISDDDKYLVVSSNYVNCYNRNGKIIFEKSHSLSEPVVKLSETRYLLYGQGESALQINSFSKPLYVQNFSSGIITAALSDSGVFAVATKTEGYNSSVSVFNKNNEKIFEWFSSDETINALSLSDNGNILAVSTVKVSNGKFISNFYVLNYKSADPLYKKSYQDDVVYQIYPTKNKVFAVALSNNIEFINYRNGSENSNKSDYALSLVKHTNGQIVVVRTIAANQDESLIEIYAANGKQKASFKVGNNITDFSYNSNKLYLLGLHDIFKYNTKGELLVTTKADYDTLFIESISANHIACIKNSSIDKFELKQKEEK